MVYFKYLGLFQKHIVGEIIYDSYWILSNKSYLGLVSVKIQGQFSFNIHSNSSYYSHVFTVSHNLLDIPFTFLKD